MTKIKQYQDRAWLEQKYWGEGLSLPKIAKDCDVWPVTILRNMEKLNIKRRSLSEALIGLKPSEKTKKKMKENHADVSGRNNPMFGIHRLGKEAPGYGKNRSEISKEKQSEAMKEWYENNPHPKGMLCKNHTKKAKEKMSLDRIGNKYALGCKHTEEVKKKKTDCSKRLWQDPKYIKNVLRAINKRPTNPEKAFDEMTPEIVRYTGNRAWWRKLNDGKFHNPDFKVTGQNKVIEVFGDYWHKGEDPQELIDLYAQAWLECLVFWEHEVYENPEQIKEKTNDFIGEII